MADSPSVNPEAQARIDLAVSGAVYVHHKFLDALKNFSLANWETTLPSLDQYRSNILPFLALPFLPRQGTAKGEAINIYDRFELSAKPDYFVTTDYWSKQDQNRISNAEKHHGHIIQLLEYSDTDNNKNSGSDGLPQYIFQLGRLILPVDQLVYAYKLPFVAVVDILDPRKAVWLVHVEDIAEDPEEGREWYPPRYVLDQFAYLFDDSNRREPVYHIAQVAPSLEEWMTLDWDTMMKNIKRTRRRGILKIKVAWEADFELAIDEARDRGMLRVLATYKVDSNAQHSVHIDTISGLEGI